MNFKAMLILAFSASIVGCSAEKQKVASVSTETNSATASVGKPSAPINMTYKVLTENPVPGQEIEIRVAFSSPLKSTVSANMQAAEGLTWASANTRWQAEISKTGQYTNLPSIKVVAPANGVYYVHLVAQVMDNGKLQSKPFTIPVKVGNAEAKLQSPGEVITDEKGQKVIIQKVDTKS